MSPTYYKIILVTSFIILFCSSVIIVKMYASNLKQDPIYDDFFPSLHDASENPLISAITDMQLFQRLEKVSQLSESKFINKNINITRREHSLGVCKLAGIYVNILNQNSSKNNGGIKVISDVQKLAIQVAGLCHDIGHGPFSHLFESALKSRNIKFDHEEQSTNIVRYIFKHLQPELVRDLPSDFVDVVCDMIIGIDQDKHKQKYSNSIYWKDFFLFTIVNAHRVNDIDVDKLDYMMRDTSVVGFKKNYLDLKMHIIDFLKDIRVENGCIVYNYNCAHSIVSFSHQYYLNYRYSYLGVDNVGASLLLGDIINEMLESTKVESLINNLDMFASFTDEYFEIQMKQVLKHPEDSRLYKLVSRLMNKEYYTLQSCCEIKSPEDLKQGAKSVIEEIINSFKGTDIGKKYNDYMVLVPVYLGHVLKHKNGSEITNVIEITPFFNKVNSNVSLSSFYNENQLSSRGTEIFKYLSGDKYPSYNDAYVDTLDAPVQLRLYLKAVDSPLSVTEINEIVTAFRTCVNTNSNLENQELYNFY